MPPPLEFSPDKTHALLLASYGSRPAGQSYAPPKPTGLLKRPYPASPGAEDPAKKPRFRAPTDLLLVCAVCLGRHQHRVVDCSEEFTWDKKFPTFAMRMGKSLFTRDRSQKVCAKWQ